MLFLICNIVQIIEVTKFKYLLGIKNAKNYPKLVHC